MTRKREMGEREGGMGREGGWKGRGIRDEAHLQLVKTELE